MLSLPRKVEANCADNWHISKEQQGYFVGSVTAKAPADNPRRPCTGDYRACRITLSEDSKMTNGGAADDD
jgi:hypothetical protein